MNKKQIILLSTSLYLLTPIVTLAENGKSKELKASIVTFSSIENDKETEESLPSDIKFDTREESIAIDNQLISEASNTSIEEVNKAMLFNTQFSKYIDKLFIKYPNMITTAYLKGVFPNQKGYVQFVGEVPKELLNSIKKLGQEKKIILANDGKISKEDNEKRVDITMKALKKLKYDNILAYCDHKTGKLNIKVRIKQIGKEPTIENIIYTINTLILASKLEGKASIFNEDDIKLITLIGKEPIIVLDKTRGGSRIYKAGTSSKCTSAWSVIVPGLGTGVMTAGHCMLNGKDKIIKHSSSGGTSAIYSMVEHDNAIYNNYDVGVYDTPTTGEEYKFWADKSHVRYTYGTNNPVIGNYSCVYGRTTNKRSCHQITKINQNAWISANGSYWYIKGLVEVSSYNSNGDYFVTQNGDSGGGWSYGNYAMGVQTGHDSSGMFFTAIDKALDAINGELY